MLKKLSTLGLVLLLTFYPVAAFAETAVTPDQDKTTNEDNIEAASENNTSKENITQSEGDSNNSESRVIESTVSSAQEEDSNSEMVQSTSPEPNEEVDSKELESNSLHVEEPEIKTEDSEAKTELKNEEDDSDEQDQENDSEEAEEIVEVQEELNLNDVHGSANGDITFDINKGHYVLDLQAGITNFHTNQEINDKWVAFTLPDGVSVPNGELPNGVMGVFIAGKTGLAVKMPDIGPSSSEHVYLDIPLTGVDNDNDPHYNTYLLDIDVEANNYTEIGQLQGQRDIDFSVMEETPSIELKGSIHGDTEYDRENTYHFLNLTVDVTNEGYEEANDIYIGFELPKDVMIINDENTPDNITILSRDEKREVVLKLPNLSKDVQENITYNIPVIGVSDKVVESNTITAFRVYDNSYSVIGEFEGQINVDFSNMDLEWHFDAIGEIISNYPGTTGNEVGFRFNYDIRNLNLDDVEGVEIKFEVPDGIEILEPEYIGGIGVDVDWNGNTAIVNINDLSGTGGYEGYFTAIGVTNLSIEQLREIEITVTLYRDGDTVVETLRVPFELGQYDNDPIDPEDPEDPNNPGPGDDDDNTDPGNQNPGDNNDNGSDNDGANNDSNNGTDDNVDNGSGTISNNDDNNKGSDGKDSGTNSSTGSSDNSSNGGNLPDTATNLYNLLFIGSLLILTGGSFMLIRKRNPSVKM
ncbi:LPXTG cell wall anchor domain-containing protein [Oceanobacillus kimchii]|uniref:LPXTG cell wall anchor domain-containing protein n=1 Tax=Oceanobacillus kimchii TaxID=746691 RepID=UPI0009857B09|nr:LPXTG cell wall anchor domain-containing protein [Oceanobacillus kimchii]MCT1577150.1 LPXTG cell wall anchor domain-containing protein [Oceanobacillus kimchii]MCT2135220.1 LPXTG cell wall anchor domain-containing protein [Oceanobacillus kimchii]